MPGLSEFFTRFKAQKLACIVDDTSSDARSALVAPAAAVTAEIANRIATLTGGLFFVSLSSSRAEAFLLSRMARPAHSPTRTGKHQETLDMCVSVEARAGVTTGISAADRAVTLNVLGEPIPNARKLVSPGHIFPVRVKDGGVLVRTAIPEASLDIVVHAGFSDAAFFVDLLDLHGDFLDPGAVESLAASNGIPVVRVQDLTSYFLAHRSLVERVSEARLPTDLAGEVKAVTFKSTIHAGEHLVLVKGDIGGDDPVLTRVQTESTLNDVFGGGERNHRDQIKTALRALGREGRGVFVYLRKPAEGFLGAEMDPAHSAGVPAMDLMREYGIGAQILHHIGVKRIKLLTNSAKHLAGLEAFGIEITEQLPL